MRKPGHLVLLWLLLAAAGSSGCPAIALTLLGVGAGVTAGTGVSYTLDSIAYKTFTASERGLRVATLKTLKRLAMAVTENQPTESGRKIVAVAGDRTIEIELDRMTSQTTRMRVNVKRGWFLRDRATAGEVILQTEQTLDNEPAPATPAAAPATPKAPAQAAPAPKK